MGVSCHLLKTSKLRAVLSSIVSDSVFHLFESLVIVLFSAGSDFVCTLFPVAFKEVLLVVSLAFDQIVMVDQDETLLGKESEERVIGRRWGHKVNNLVSWRRKIDCHSVDCDWRSKNRLP
jgi:hypothetical protein